MSRWLLVLTVAVAFAVSCDKKDEPVPATPTATATPVVVNDIESRAQAQLEFLAVALVEQRDTLDKVTCHCCGKSIAKCYQDTLVSAEGACPPT